jgi:hypothetical protein
LHFSLLANSGLGATLNFLPGVAPIGFLCNCDESFTIPSIRKSLADEKYGEKDTPSLLYRLEITSRPELVVPNKWIPVWILVYLFAIA